MNRSPIKALLDTWSSQVEVLRRRGLDAEARLMESMAEEVARALQTCAEELVSVAEALEISGYSRDSIGRLIQEGKLDNQGTRDRPRVRRGDLPRKPGHLPKDELPLHLLGASPTQVARAIVNLEGEAKR